MKTVNVLPVSTAKKLTKKELEFARVQNIEKAEFEKPGFKERTTFLVSDYTVFEFIQSNREIIPNPRLKEDLAKFGQLDPITVKKSETGKLIIFNGQHRLYHLKELGLPVECIELSNDFEGNYFDAIKSLNVKGSSWTKDNYSVHYVTENNPNYVKFRNINSFTSNLSETIVYSLVNNGKSGELKKLYENGNLKFEPTDKQVERIKLLNELMALVKGARKDSGTKSYFDKPQIVNLLNSFIEETKNFDLNILKQVLIDAGHTLNKDVTLEQFDDLYTSVRDN